MKKHSCFMSAVAATGMLLLILDSQCAYDSACKAVSLCIRSVIPSLFPFLFFSGLLTSALWGSSNPVIKLIASFFHIPKGAESLFLAGLLGGYPAGAAAIGSAFRSGHLNKESADRLLGYCCNAGPAFIFGIIGPQFSQKWMIGCIWGIHILSAAMTSAVLPCPLQIQMIPEKKQTTITANMSGSVKTMAMICGWIVLFRVLIGFLDRWFLWALPEAVGVTICGILELSNACCELSAIENVTWRLIVASGLLSFGGICVMMQTASAVSPLSIKAYVTGKVLQTVFTVLLASAAVTGWVMLLVTLILVSILVSIFSKKEVAFRFHSLYNTGNH